MFRSIRNLTIPCSKQTRQVTTDHCYGKECSFIRAVCVLKVDRCTYRFARKWPPFEETSSERWGHRGCIDDSQRIKSTRGERCPDSSLSRRSFYTLFPLLRALHSISTRFGTLDNVEQNPKVGAAVYSNKKKKRRKRRE